MTTRTGTETPVTAGIRTRLDTLYAAEARVARVVLGLGPDLIHRSASEVAAAADTALSTVVRTCQRLGFKGFNDLKLAVARDGRPVSPAEMQEDVEPGDPPDVVLGKVFSGARDAVGYAGSHVDAGAFTRAVTAVTAARRVLCLGVGTSAPLAQDIAYRLGWLGLDGAAPADAHVQHVAASGLGPADVALVVSHTGSTRETVTSARAARDAGAAVVAVTSFPNAPLSAYADPVLVAAGRETAYRTEAMASRIAHLTILDALWVAAAVARGERALVRVRRANDVISEHRY